jgi:hypothetical protein
VNCKHFSIAVAIIALLTGLWIALAKTKAPPSVKLTILCPDGRVADGATVIIVPPKKLGRLFIFGGDVNPPPMRDGQQFHSGPNGVAFIPFSTPLDEMVVLHSTGYAELSPDAWMRGGPIKLLEWARIEGQLMIGSRPGVAQTVRAQVSFDRFRKMDWLGSFFLDAQTDVNGRFALERVPPVGAVEVSRIVNTNRMSQATAFDVAPGQTTQVKLGGIGRPIVGQLDVPAELMARHDWA